MSEANAFARVVAGQSDEAMFADLRRRHGCRGKNLGQRPGAICSGGFRKASIGCTTATPAAAKPPENYEAIAYVEAP